MEVGAGARGVEDRRRAGRPVEDPRVEDAGKVPRFRPRGRIFWKHPGPGTVVGNYGFYYRVLKKMSNSFFAPLSISIFLEIWCSPDERTRTL